MKLPKKVKYVGFDAIDRLTLECPHELRNEVMAALESEEHYDVIKCGPKHIGPGQVSSTTSIIVAEKTHICEP